MNEPDSTTAGTRPILLIDDERAMRDSIAQWLELAGMDVRTFDCGETALKQLDRQFPGVVVTDLRMPGYDGMDVLRSVQAIDPDIPTLIITGHGDIKTAVDAMQNGAYDFVEKPFQPERLSSAIARAIKNRGQLLDIRRLKARVATDAGLSQRLLGDCAAMRDIREQITNLADIDVSVLLVGETGTGKGVIAKCLHDISHRNEASFSVIDCSAIPSDSVERELFGEIGDSDRASPFELASGGTLLLDELVNMPSEQQVKLLRLLEVREVKRVGEQIPRPFDVKLIGAVDDSIDESLANGKFRKDLYFRMNTVEIRIPPLRERGDDVVMLFRHFVKQSANLHDRDTPEIGVQDMAALKQHTWPGNVRELKSIAERFVLYGGLAIERLLSDHDTRSNVNPGKRKLVDAVNAFEKSLLEQSLNQTKGDIAAAAELLGLPRRTLNDKLQRHEIDRNQFRDAG